MKITHKYCFGDFIVYFLLCKTASCCDENLYAFNWAQYFIHHLSTACEF